MRIKTVLSMTAMTALFVALLVASTTYAAPTGAKTYVGQMALYFGGGKGIIKGPFRLSLNGTSGTFSCRCSLSGLYSVPVTVAGNSVTFETSFPASGNMMGATATWTGEFLISADGRSMRGEITRFNNGVGTLNFAEVVGALSLGGPIAQR